MNEEEKTEDKFREHCRKELEWERTRRLHTHDLIFKVMTAYVTITLAVIGGSGFFLRDRIKPANKESMDGYHEARRTSCMLHDSPTDCRSEPEVTFGGHILPEKSDLAGSYSITPAIGILVFGFLVALLHHVYLLNLRIDRDIHFKREILLRKALDFFIIEDNENDARSKYKEASDYSRGSKTFKLFNPRLSLFAMFGLFIYIGNIFLIIYAVWLLPHDKVITCWSTLIMVLCIIVHTTLIRAYYLKYLAFHKKLKAGKKEDGSHSVLKNYMK